MKIINFLLEDGLLFKGTTNKESYSIFGVSSSKIKLTKTSTFFGIVFKGTVYITDKFGTMPVSAGMSFVINNGNVMSGKSDNQCVVIELAHYKGLRQFCGPIESKGRLHFLDECSDTTIVFPPKYGEPCLNHLHIPKNVIQTPHTHPSDRVGIVMKGSLECVTVNETVTMTPGNVWIIPKDVIHSFNTTNSSVDLITWHPDSEFGPTDEDHPMINRTSVAT